MEGDFRHGESGGSSAVERTNMKWVLRFYTMAAVTIVCVGTVLAQPTTLQEQADQAKLFVQALHIAPVDRNHGQADTIARVQSGAYLADLAGSVRQSILAHLIQPLPEPVFSRVKEALRTTIQTNVPQSSTGERIVFLRLDHGFADLAARPLTAEDLAQLDGQMVGFKDFVIQQGARQFAKQYTADGWRKVVDNAFASFFEVGLPLGAGGVPKPLTPGELAQVQDAVVALMRKASEAWAVPPTTGPVWTVDYIMAESKGAFARKARVYPTRVPPEIETLTRKYSDEQQTWLSEFKADSLQAYHSLALSVFNRDNSLALEAFGEVLQDAIEGGP